MSALVRCDGCGQETRHELGTVGWFKLDTIGPDYTVSLHHAGHQMPHHYCSKVCIVRHHRVADTCYTCAYRVGDNCQVLGHSIRFVRGDVNAKPFDFACNRWQRRETHEENR